MVVSCLGGAGRGGKRGTSVPGAGGHSPVACTTQGLTMGLPPRNLNDPITSTDGPPGMWDGPSRGMSMLPAQGAAEGRRGGQTDFRAGTKRRVINFRLAKKADIAILGTLCKISLKAKNSGTRHRKKKMTLSLHKLASRNERFV